MKNSKGITLIALTVTIIVLIILASISISALNGDSSIVKQATEAQIMTELSNVKEALEIYKIRNHSDGDMSDEELVEEGLLKEVFINDTYRTIAVLTDLKKIEVNGKLGKSGGKQEETEVNTLLDLYNVYGIDMSDGTLYYIRNGIWSIEGNKTTYTAETGEEKEGYEIETINKQYLEDMKFVTEWTVEAGTTITLPISVAPDITIEWGDGTEEKCTVIKPTHTYTEAGTHTIKIAGNMPEWIFSNITESKDYITSLKQWGMTGVEKINFKGCINLEGTIPSHKLKGEFALLKNVNSLFNDCVNISGSIPIDLFEDCTNTLSLSYVFSGCTGLTGTIPENLFSNCTSATYLSYVFSGCTGLTGEIPGNLFSNSLSATYFTCLFSGCTGLTGTIPENLFSNNNKVIDLNCVFQGCTGLTGTIPEDLFKTNTKAGNFNNLFDGCTGLIGTIPEKLFYNNTKATFFFRVFAGCTGLTGEIPAKLFKGNTELTDVKEIFRGCTGLTGEIPECLLKNCPKITSVYMMFADTSITEIPSNLFDTNNGNSNEIIHMGGVFENTKITTVPEGLFDLCTEVISFGNEYGYSGIFQDCILLETIPDKLFYNNTKVTSFANAFCGCINLKEIPDNTFNTAENVSMYKVFANCKSLTKISNEVFKNTPNVTKWSSAFENCTELVEIGDQFTINSSAASISRIFYKCSKLTKFPSQIVIPENVTDIVSAFNGCSQLVTTIVLKTNSVDYRWAFGRLNSASKVNWSSPCTEEFVDEILTACNNTAIKGVEVTE